MVHVIVIKSKVEGFWAAKWKWSRNSQETKVGTKYPDVDFKELSVIQRRSHSKYQ